MPEGKIVRKSTNLAKRQGAVARQKRGRPQKVPTNTKVWKKDGGARALFNEVTSLRGGIPQLRDQPERLRGNCPAYTCTVQNT